MQRFRVLIADDEPPITRTIKTLIQRSQLPFEVVGIAYDCDSAQKEILHLKPDVVFTDIRMPPFDGLSLIDKCKQELPTTSFVVISGFYEFNYAYRAIQTGVDGYILKPINPEQFTSVLGEVVKKQNQLYFRKLIDQLKGESLGLPLEKSWFVNYFRSEKIHVAGIKFGTFLSSSIDPNNQVKEEQLIDCSRYIENNFQWIDAFCIIPEVIDGFLVLILCEEFEYINLVPLAQCIQHRLQKTDNYTFVYSNRLVSITEIPAYSATIEKRLKELVIPEADRISDISEKDPSPRAGKRYTENINSIVRVAQTGNANRLLKDLERFYLQLQQDRVTQRTFEQIEEKLVDTLSESLIGINDLHFSGNDNTHLNAYYLQAFCNLLETVNERIHEKSENITEKEILYEHICSYCKSHLTEEISLQSEAERNHISQSKLSAIFRQYSQKSFNEYLTDIRIEEAKRLILKDKDARLGDIGRMVGYNDPYYFSKRFKSITGYAPSEFRATLSASDKS